MQALSLFNKMRYRFLRFPDGKEKALTFSYDDGCLQDVRLSELFANRGLKATFNINTFAFNKNTEGRLGAEEIRKYIIDKGHEVAAHGDYHIAPASARPVDAIRDIYFGRLRLEDAFNIIVRGMAYPDTGILVEANGNTVSRVKAQLSDLGVAYARTLGGDNDGFELPSDWYEWTPSAHHNNPLIFDYIDKFLSISRKDAYYASARPALFYIWGHSYELDKNDGWDRMEKIADALSAREDIWYATNIEIYDYVKAYDALIISADGTRVYNPTLIKVWFFLDGEIYSVAPGEHIRVRDTDRA